MKYAMISKKLTGLLVLSSFTITSCSTFTPRSSNEEISKREVASFGDDVATGSGDLATGSDVYQFGGSCQMQGKWSQAAASQLSQLKTTIEKLMNNPHCKDSISGIYKSIQNVKIEDAILDEQKEGQPKQTEISSLKRDFDAMKFLFKGDEQNSSANEPSSDQIKLDFDSKFFEKTKAGVSQRLFKGLQQGKFAGNIERARRVAVAGLDILDGYLSALPALDRCLSEDTVSGGMLLSGAIKLTAAGIGGQGGTQLGMLADRIAKLTDVLRKRKFTKILAKLDKNEYWDSVQCLLESTTDLFCTIRDEQKMLHGIRDKISEALSEEKDANSLLEGYFVQLNSVPTTTLWFSKLLYNTDSGTSGGSSMLENVTAVTATVKKMKNEVLRNFEYKLNTLPDAASVKAEYIALISSLMSEMSVNPGEGAGGRSIFNITGTDSATPPATNFFLTEDITANLFPFWLIGSNQIPDICNPSVTDTTKLKAWDWWMKNDQSISQKFKGADMLRTIKTNIDKISELAQSKASASVTKSMTINPRDAVLDALSKYGLSKYTPQEALTNISEYLQRFINRASREYGRSSSPFVAEAIELKGKVDRIIDSVNKSAAQGASIDDAREIIAVVDREIDLFRYNTLKFKTSISKIVSYDLSLIEDRLTSEQRNNMLLLGKNMIDTLSGIGVENPDLLEKDLNRAFSSLAHVALPAINEMFKDVLLEKVITYSTMVTGQKPGFFTKDWWKFSVKNRRAYGDSEAGELALACIQSLALDDKGAFFKYCSKTTLNASYMPLYRKGSREDLSIQNSLNARYLNYFSSSDIDYSNKTYKDESGKSYSYAVGNMNSAKRTNVDAICALKDYKKRVQIYHTLYSIIKSK